MNTPVIITGYCLTYRGGKNIYVPGFFTNGTKVKPMPFNFGIKGCEPAGHILELKETDYGLWLKAKVTGGREALKGYEGLSVTLAFNHWSKIGDHFMVYNAHMMGINIVKSYRRKGVPKVIPYTTFVIEDIVIEQADLFGEVA